MKIHLLLASIVAVGLAAASEAVARDLVAAVGTTLYDSGLLGELVPVFAAETGVHVKLLSVGTGAALRMGEQGDVDLVLTHDPESEEAALVRGAFVDRRPFAENFFLIAGPAADPVGVAKAPGAADALRRIADASAPFVSRGDESGTHLREQALLRAAGRDPAKRWQGYVATGAGMGATLQVAGERRAYVLTDPATFRAFRERIALTPLTRPEAALRNVYSVLLPNTKRLPAGRVDVERAKCFADYLTAPATQARMRAFATDADGAPLFRPITAP